MSKTSDPAPLPKQKGLLQVLNAEYIRYISALVDPPQLQLVICAYWFAPLNVAPVAEHVGLLYGVATIDVEYESGTVEPVVQPRKSNSCSVPAQLEDPVAE